MKVAFFLGREVVRSTTKGLRSAAIFLSIGKPKEVWIIVKG